MASADVGGITVGYDDSGAGPDGTLVLVHGHPFDRTMWAPQQRAFAGRVRVIAPDLRGYGRSGVVPGTTPLGVFAHDIAALLDRLAVPRATLCGLSMGGQSVLEFHRLFPERVAGLVLADTFAQGETPQGRAERNARADALLRDGMAPYAHSVLDSMLTPANVAALPDVAAHVLRMMLGTPPEGAAAALRGRAERPDYTAMLAHIAVPALVVVGSDDVFTPVEDARFMHERIPGARLAVIDGAGHMPNLERPADFDRALAGLLDAVAEQERRGGAATSATAKSVTGESATAKFTNR